MSPNQYRLQGVTPYRNTKHKATNCTADDVMHTLEHTKKSLKYNDTDNLKQVNKLTQQLKKWHFSSKVDIKRFLKVEQILDMKWLKFYLVHVKKRCFNQLLS